MKRVLFFLLSCCATMVMAQQSPNGKITVEPHGQTLAVRFQQQSVIEVTTAVDVSTLSQCEPQRITTDYEMVAGKRRHCTNEANEYRCGQLVLRIYNDGLAFRFEKPRAVGSVSDGSSVGPSPDETSTTYRIAEGTPRWMQQWCEAYEGFYPFSTTAKVPPVPSFSGVFKSDDGYAAMSSVKTWEKMRAMGIQSELHTLALRNHCFQRTASPGTGSYTWLDRIGEFLQYVLKQ